MKPIDRPFCPLPPWEPCIPGTPADPWMPCTPCIPCNPCGPDCPGDPGGPIGPWIPQHCIDWPLDVVHVFLSNGDILLPLMPLGRRPFDDFISFAILWSPFCFWLSVLQWILITSRHHRNRATSTFFMVVRSVATLPVSSLMMGEETQGSEKEESNLIKARLSFSVRH